MHNISSSYTLRFNGHILRHLQQKAVAVPDTMNKEEVPSKKGKAAHSPVPADIVLRKAKNIIHHDWLLGYVRKFHQISQDSLDL